MYHDLNEEVEINLHDGIDVEIDMNDVEQIVFNSPITDEEIIKSVKSMKMSNSAGLDDIPPVIVIHCIDIIVPLVKRFFNRLFDLGVFPED